MFYVHTQVSVPVYLAPTESQYTGRCARLYSIDLRALNIHYSACRSDGQPVALQWDMRPCERGAAAGGEAALTQPLLMPEIASSHRPLSTGYTDTGNSSGTNSTSGTSSGSSGKAGTLSYAGVCSSVGVDLSWEVRLTSPQGAMRVLTAGSISAAGVVWGQLQGSEWVRCRAVVPGAEVPAVGSLEVWAVNIPQRGSRAGVAGASSGVSGRNGRSRDQIEAMEAMGLQVVALPLHGVRWVFVFVSVEAVHVYATVTFIW